jgi:HAD superfamily hydrolase (TIGR01509 family)
MDGTMLDTERPVVDGWIEGARLRGWNVSPGAVLRTVGLDEPSTRAVLLEECGPAFPYEEVRRELRRILTGRADREGFPHRPGLLTLLDRLAALNIPLGVATSTSRDRALRKLGGAGILDRFAVLACGDEVREGKPAPDIFLLAAERLGAAPGLCVGFEDSPAGLTALRRAGIPSVFVKDLIEPPPEALAGVWRCCGDLAEAAALF